VWAAGKRRPPVLCGNRKPAARVEVPSETSTGVPF
jgi:hypothetical protein